MSVNRAQTCVVFSCQWVTIKNTEINKDQSAMMELPYRSDYNKNTACDIFLFFWQGISVGCFALLMHRLLQALNYWEPLQLSFRSQQHSFIPHLVAGISPSCPLLDERIQLQDQLTLTLSRSDRSPDSFLTDCSFSLFVCPSVTPESVKFAHRLLIKL